MLSFPIPIKYAFDEVCVSRYDAIFEYEKRDLDFLLCDRFNAQMTTLHLARNRNL